MQKQLGYLSGHNFGIGARDVDPGVEASSVMSLYDVSAVDLVGANSAVVGALRSGETILWPSEGMLVLIQKGVLLLDSEPWNKVLGPRGKIYMFMSGIEIHQV